MGNSGETGLLEQHQGGAISFCTAGHTNPSNFPWKILHFVWVPLHFFEVVLLLWPPFPARLVKGELQWR